MKLSNVEKRRRIFMMVFGAFAIFFTGYPHIWSIYQPYIMELTGWSQGQTSMCFYLSFLTFVLGNIVGGRIQDNYNPKIVIMIGGAIFSGGVLLSAFLILPSPYPMYFTYGIMQGFGQGMIYTTIVSTAQKWFPGRTGFASGVVVTANGMCGFFLAPISREILDASGPKTAFLLIGTAIAVSWIFGCIFIKGPARETIKLMSGSLQSAENNKTSGSEAYSCSAAEMIRTRKFYFLAATMMCGLISYFMVSPVSQTVQMERGIPAAVAVGAVMLGSILNAGTRLCLPAIADKAGRLKCVKGVILVSIAAMILLAVSDSYLCTAGIVLMYGCYGGIMGSFPSLTSSIFGIGHSGENYGYVMFGIVLAALGAPFLTNGITSRGYNIKLVFGAGIGFAILSLLFAILLEKEINKKNRNPKKEEMLATFE